MSGHGGKRERAGRPKGALNKENQIILSFLENNKVQDLLDKAYELAMGGNAAVMTKLLDKILPSLNHNQNENNPQTFEDYLLAITNKEN